LRGAPVEITAASFLIILLPVRADPTCVFLLWLFLKTSY